MAVVAVKKNIFYCMPLAWIAYLFWIRLRFKVSGTSCTENIIILFWLGVKKTGFDLFCSCQQYISLIRFTYVIFFCWKLHWRKNSNLAFLVLWCYVRQWIFKVKFFQAIFALKKHSLSPTLWLLSIHIFLIWLSNTTFFLAVIVFEKHHLYIFLIYTSIFYYDQQFYIIRIIQFYIDRNYTSKEF